MAPREPKRPDQITVVPFTVDHVEEMRAYMLEHFEPLDAALISVLAYLARVRRTRWGWSIATSAAEPCSSSRRTSTA
jgi:hypothetical protein